MSFTRRIQQYWPIVIVASVTLAAPLLAGGMPQQAVMQMPPPAPVIQQTGNADKPLEPARGAISGTVLDGTTGAPVPAAIVNLMPTILSRPLIDVQPRQMTDEKGRFAFVNLAGDSQYMISVTKFGYLDGGYGRDGSPASQMRTLALKTDEWFSTLKVTIWRPGSISGVVRDESGEPVVGVFVRVLLRVRINAREDVAAGPMVITDDRGAYRFSGLTPGRYYVQVPSVQASIPSATTLATGTRTTWDGALDVDDSHRLVIGRYPLPPPPVAGRQMAYPVIFHPGTSALAQARAIELGYGADQTNIDLALTPVPSVRVSGVVDGPPESFASLTLRLLPVGLENLGLGAEAATALAAPDGRFTFLNVPAGSYTLDAPVSVGELSMQGVSGNFRRGFPAPPPAQGRGMNSDNIELIPGLELQNTSFRGGTPAAYSGRMPLTVGGSEVSGVVLRLRPHANMSGRITIEADPAKPDMKPPPRFPIALDSASGDASLGRPQSSFQSPPGEFAIASIVPGRYLLRVYGYPGWLVKSVTWKGHDYTNEAFDTAAVTDLSGVEVVVTNLVPDLSGSVRGSDELKADGAMVIAFPPDPERWRNIGLNPIRMKAATVTNLGQYRFTNLPAGDYLLVAVDLAHASTWRDPEFLQKAARSASRVSLTWGRKMSQDVPTVVIK